MHVRIIAPSRKGPLLAPLQSLMVFDVSKFGSTVQVLEFLLDTMVYMSTTRARTSRRGSDPPPTPCRKFPLRVSGPMVLLVGGNSRVTEALPMVPGTSQGRMVLQLGFYRPLENRDRQYPLLFS